MNELISLLSKIYYRRKERKAIKERLKDNKENQKLSKEELKILLKLESIAKDLSQLAKNEENKEFLFDISKGFVDERKEARENLKEISKSKDISKSFTRIMEGFEKASKKADIKKQNELINEFGKLYEKTLMENPEFKNTHQEQFKKVKDFYEKTVLKRESVNANKTDNINKNDEAVFDDIQDYNKDIISDLESKTLSMEEQVEKLENELNQAKQELFSLINTKNKAQPKLEIIEKMQIKKKHSSLNQSEFEIYGLLPSLIRKLNNDPKLNLGFRLSFSIQVAFSSLVKFKNSEGYEAFNVFNKLYCDFVFFKSFKKDCILEPFLILEYHGEGHFQNDAANTNDKVKRELAEKIDIGYYELPYDKYNSFNNKKSSIKEIILDELEKQI